MPGFTVNYDLHRERDYSKLIEYLTSLGGVHTLESCWLVTYNGNAATLRDSFKSLLHASDKVVIVGANSADWATAGPVSPATTAWLLKNVAP